MSYSVKEIYFTLQGEGANAGRPAVFCRFAGCNLWTGREEDRHKSICQFCDTNFVGTDGPRGGVYATGKEIAEAVDSCWPKNDDGGWVGNKLVVCTGGDATLKFDRFFLQPMDGPLQNENIQLAAHYCLKYPQWELSLQTHKLIGLP